jgi:hypothetical protein
MFTKSRQNDQQQAAEKDSDEEGWFAEPGQRADRVEHPCVELPEGMEAVGRVLAVEGGSHT